MLCPIKGAAMLYGLSKATATCSDLVTRAGKIRSAEPVYSWHALPHTTMLSRQKERRGARGKKFTLQSLKRKKIWAESWGWAEKTVKLARSMGGKYQVGMSHKDTEWEGTLQCQYRFADRIIAAIARAHKDPTGHRGNNWKDDSWRAQKQQCLYKIYQ